MRRYCAAPRAKLRAVRIAQFTVECILWACCEAVGRLPNFGICQRHVPPPRFWVCVHIYSADMGRCISGATRRTQAQAWHSCLGVARCPASCRPLTNPDKVIIACSEFTWIFVCSIFLALFVAYGECAVGLARSCVVACSRTVLAGGPAPRPAAAASQPLSQPTAFVAALPCRYRRGKLTGHDQSAAGMAAVSTCLAPPAVSTCRATCSRPLPACRTMWPMHSAAAWVSATRRKPRMHTCPELFFPACTLLWTQPDSLLPARPPPPSPARRQGAHDETSDRDSGILRVRRRRAVGALRVCHLACCSPPARWPWPTPCGAHDLQGAGVTDTIRGKIADLNYYKNKPDLYM